MCTNLSFDVRVGLESVRVVVEVKDRLGSRLGKVALGLGELPRTLKIVAGPRVAVVEAEGCRR